MGLPLRRQIVRYRLRPLGRAKSTITMVTGGFLFSSLCFSDALLELGVLLPSVGPLGCCRADEPEGCTAVGAHTDTNTREAAVKFEPPPPQDSTPLGGFSCAQNCSLFGVPPPRACAHLLCVPAARGRPLGCRRRDGMQLRNVRHRRPHSRPEHLRVRDARAPQASRGA